jgi:IS5 family transposase
MDRFQREARKIAMSQKKTIRIVKKGEKPRPVAKVKPANTARETAREMVETVTNWVTEFQQRRRSETTNALRILSKTPRGSEA